MSERPYSRLYWEVMDDPKFDGVREDVRHFGTWSLLLVVADMAWPASAFLPPFASKASLALLVEHGLVDVMAGGRYRIHGLNRERNERSAKARAAATVRHAGAAPPHSNRTASAVQPQSVSSANGLLDEYETSTRRDETSIARPPVTVVIDYLEERTGRPYQFGAGSKVHECLSPDVRDFGPEAVIEAMRADGTEHPDIGQLVFSASRRLHPVNGAEKAIDPDPEYVAAQIAAQREARRKARSADAH